jgi:hypothetical protein
LRDGNIAEYNSVVRVELADQGEPAFLENISPQHVEL